MLRKSQKVKTAFITGANNPKGIGTAIESFTRSSSYEMGPFGITINTIACDPVQTGYISKENKKSLSSKIPMRRIGDPDDIANAVKFLVSKKADWITGQVIKISGGHGT